MTKTKAFCSVMVLIAMIVYWYSPDIQQAYDNNFYYTSITENRSQKLDFMSAFASEKYKKAYNLGANPADIDNTISHVLKVARNG